jgi:DNA mismatch repair protein MutL
MSRIRILPDQVANQIAAGEVVERPVGAVKELLENSLDAGATRVEIEFRNGGKSYIRVEDNGCGMTPEEALICLERHATSKLRNAKDLDHIISFGFRGEAIPSIASISKFTLSTRPHDSTEGTQLLLQGGKLLHNKTCGMPPGTRIEAANLFFNTPARKKFLKTENTEAAHISRIVKLYAIAHPEVAFSLYSGKRCTFQSPVCTDLRDRIREVFGGEVAEHLVDMPVAQDPDCRITGKVSPPGHGRPTRQDIVTIVNGRPVESRTLLYALTEAYHPFIPKGKYPAAFLHIEIDPEFIDVNIHPQKREIRFRSEAHIRRLIIENIHKMAESSHAGINSAVVIPPTYNSPDFLPSTSENSTNLPKPSPLPSNFHPVTPVSESTANSVPENTSTVSHVEPRQAPHPQQNWKYITQLQSHLALYQTSAGYILLHTKAARERIHFERILHSSSEHSPSQQLLLPVPLHLDPLSNELLQQHKELLAREGFHIEAFGRDFYRIESIPPWLDTSQAEDFLRQFLDSAREHGQLHHKPDLQRKTLAELAARQFSNQSNSLTEAELSKLPTTLLACQHPHTSPNGHITFFELSTRDLEKKFGRSIT